MYDIQFKTIVNENSCEFHYKDIVVIFKHKGLVKNIPIHYHVRSVGDFSERKYANRIDIYIIKNNKEKYVTNFIWDNYKEDNDFVKECENIFYNYFKNYKETESIDLHLRYFETVSDEYIQELYEDDKHETLYLTLKDYTLVFIPQEKNFDTSRINVFQIIDDKHFLYRSNFEMNDIQGKADFVATCKKYFYIWFKVNNKNETFNKPIFNDYPWKMGLSDNHWWEFDKFAEMSVYTPRTMSDNTKHPLLYNFLIWQQSKGFSVNLDFPEVF